MTAKEKHIQAGRLIVMEGADDAGKSTLSKLLVERLVQAGHNAALFSFPGREAGTLGAQIYEFHHRAPATNLVSRQLLHIAAHIDAVEGRILPAIREGKIIVLDRFWWSTWVYGMVSGAHALSLKAMIDLEKFHWQEVLPTIVFLISRSQGRAGNNETDRHKLIAEYARLAAQEENLYPISHIKNEGSRDAAMLSIINALEKTGVGLPKFENKISFSDKQTQIQFEKSNRKSSPMVFSRLSPAKPTVVYDQYWRFAVERQDIFFARLANCPWPWTEDTILREYKFTNT
jgi:thymidylate kinase